MFCISNNKLSLENSPFTKTGQLKAIKTCSAVPAVDSRGPLPYPGINYPLVDIYHSDGSLPALHHAQSRHTALIDSFPANTPTGSK